MKKKTPFIVMVIGFISILLGVLNGYELYLDFSTISIEYSNIWRVKLAILAVAFFIVGVSLFKMKNWSRLSFFILLPMGIFFGLDYPYKWGWLIPYIISLLYLTHPSVREQFK